MRYRVKVGQVSYGEAIGIVLLENYAPFIPGDVANATTYSYPVRFQRVEGFTVERIFRHDMELLDAVTEAVAALQREGVRAVTGDCGFMAIYQQQIARNAGIPVFLSSLMQIPFISQIIGRNREIGVITANKHSLTPELFHGAGVPEELLPALRIRGLEDHDHFTDAVVRELGELDTDLVEAAVVQRAVDLSRDYPEVRAILLECSLLPPYGAAVQEAVGLPVFDFVTMIDFVYSAVVKRRFSGFM